MKHKFLKTFLSVGILSMLAFPLSSSAAGQTKTQKCRTIVLTGIDAYLATKGESTILVWTRCGK